MDDLRVAVVQSLVEQLVNEDEVLAHGVLAKGSAIILENTRNSMQHLKHKVGLHVTRYVPGERRSVVAFVATRRTETL